MTERIAPKRPVCFLVPTPLGMTEDLSFRAITALRVSSLLLCEDEKSTRSLLRELRIDPWGKKIVVIGDVLDRRVVSMIDRVISEKSALAVVSSGGIPGYYDPGKCYIDLLTTTYLKKVLLIDIAGPSALSQAIMLSSVIFGPVIVLDKYGHDRPFNDPALIRKADEVPLISFIEIERTKKDYAVSPLAAAIELLKKVIGRPLYLEVFSNLSRPGGLVLKGAAGQVEKRLQVLSMTEHEFVLVCTTEDYRNRVRRGIARY